MVSNKPLSPPPYKTPPAVDMKAKAADEARASALDEKVKAAEEARKAQAAKLHEMRHMTNPHELEHNYHAPDKSDEGEKPATGDKEVVEVTGTLTGKPAKGASAYGPGPAQQPLHKLKGIQGL